MTPCPEPTRASCLRKMVGKVTGGPRVTALGETPGQWIMVKNVCVCVCVKCCGLGDGGGGGGL